MRKIVVSRAKYRIIASRRKLHRDCFHVQRRESEAEPAPAPAPAHIRIHNSKEMGPRRESETFSTADAEPVRLAGISDTSGPLIVVSNRLPFVLTRDAAGCLHRSHR